jgi:hypothetical protein
VVKRKPSVFTTGMIEPYAMTIEAAAQWAGISRTRLEQMLRDRNVRCIRAGRRTLVVVVSLRTHLESLPSAR